MPETTNLCLIEKFCFTKCVDSFLENRYKPLYSKLVSDEIYQQVIDFYWNKLTILCEDDINKEPLTNVKNNILSLSFIKNTLDKSRFIESLYKLYKSIDIVPKHNCYQKHINLVDYYCIQFGNPFIADIAMLCKPEILNLAKFNVDTLTPHIKDRIKLIMMYCSVLIYKTSTCKCKTNLPKKNSSLTIVEKEEEPLQLEKKLIDNKDLISKSNNNLLDNKDPKMSRKSQVTKKENIQLIIHDSDDEESFAVHPEMPTIPVDNINICFVGGVSTGKSTILNAIFCEELTQCKIKRTTMVPTIYVENENDTENITSPELIFTTISDINKKIIEKTETGQPTDRSEYRELVFNVGKLDINILNGSYVNVYDIPGLNDVRTKDVYYSYLDDNFTKFNLVVLIVDIHSGLNTSDEMQIVDYITTHTREEMEKNGKNIYTLVVVNKADYMQLEDESDDKLILTGELNEMFEQVQNTITAEFTKRNIKDNLIGIIPLCALDSYLYRMVKKNGKKFKLSQEQILKIGINEDGKKFSKLKPATQEKKVYEILANKEFIDDMIKLSGFSHLESILHKFLSENDVGRQIRVNNLLFELKKLPSLHEEVLLAAPIMSSKNIINWIEKYIKILNIVKKIDYETYSNKMMALSKEYTSALEIIIKTINDVSYIIDNYKKAHEEIIEPYFDLFFKSIFEDDSIYPEFLKNRVISLVVTELKDKVITIGNIVLAFNGLKDIDCFTKANLNYLIRVILTNCNHNNTISDICEKNTTDMDNYTIDLFIKLLDECKELDVNISTLLRFVFICLYKNYDETKLIQIKMLLTKHGEIPLNMYINQINTSNDAGLYYYSYYVYGLKEEDFDDFKLEMYYLSHEKKHNPINFVGL